MIITDFKLSPWLIVDVKSILRFLHRVTVGDIVDVSEVQLTSIFNVVGCTVCEVCVYGSCFEKQHREEEWGLAPHLGQ
jgi:hypothetical protein